MHGGIGFVDVETILIKEGYQPIEFPCHDQFSVKAKFKRLFFLVKIVFSVQGPSVVVFISPIYASLVKVLLRLLNRKPGVRIICCIGDIDGIKDGNKKGLEKDIKQLRRYHHFIVHNNAMRQWVDQHIPERKTAVIDFFDFLAKPYEGDRILSRDIVFAGNLEKSVFLEKLGELSSSGSGLHFYLYGPGSTEKMLSQKNATWMGIEKPYDLPAKLKGSFGLLWDGDSIGEPGGSLGDYMQYISHHKLSLYILSGLPLIVPAIAASAALVEKYKIGIIVKSLYEIEDKIKNVTDDEYQQMKKNMQPLASKNQHRRLHKRSITKINVENTDWLVSLNNQFFHISSVCFNSLQRCSTCIFFLFYNIIFHTVFLSGF